MGVPSYPKIKVTWDKHIFFFLNGKGGGIKKKTYGSHSLSQDQHFWSLPYYILKTFRSVFIWSSKVSQVTRFDGRNWYNDSQRSVASIQFSEESWIYSSNCKSFRKFCGSKYWSSYSNNRVIVEVSQVQV
jgi:hypothetical protein